MKQVLEIKEVEPGVILVKLEATKRRKIWMEKTEHPLSCPDLCPLQRTCTRIPSPLINKYPNFGEFCNKLFEEYPELHYRLAIDFGIMNINQTVIKKNRN